MNSPPNISRSVVGYNNRMFEADRDIRSAFRVLGYPIKLDAHKVSRKLVMQFQRDYNRCSKRFKKWGEIDVNGRLDKDTLNGLEIAVLWAKRQVSGHEGSHAAMAAWQGLCKVDSGKCRDHDESSPAHQGRGYAAAEEEETNYVEILPNGMAKLRNIHNDRALRANLVDFERCGSVIFATVILPPQADLPSGRKYAMTCPCIFARG